jgi:hypothetical protein
MYETSVKQKWSDGNHGMLIQQTAPVLQATAFVHQTC